MKCSSCLAQQDTDPSGCLIPFSPVTLADKPWIDRIIRLEDSRSSAWCFANMFFWIDTYNPRVSTLDDRLLIRFTYEGDSTYGFPIGQGDLRPAILALQQDAAARGVPFHLRGLTEQSRALLEEAFPDRFDYVADTSVFDYIYEAEKLATLSGKKLHGKRNHINRFLETYPDWRFEPITRENIPACLAMSEVWAKEREALKNLSSEFEALHLAFDNFEALGLEGGLLRVYGDVVAFTVGGVLNSDTFIVHFEKAFPAMQGAYPMINREFVRHVMETHPHIRYINREEDLGIESLQKAKRSYYPVFMVEKYRANWRGA